METIIKLFLLIVILHIYFAEYSDISKTNEDELDTAITTAPIIAEVTAVTTPTNDSIPNYTFSSTEPGTITYGTVIQPSTTFLSNYCKIHQII